MQSYVDNAMKIAEKVGFANKKGGADNMESAKETLTLSGTLSDPHRVVGGQGDYQRDQMKQMNQHQQEFASMDDG